MHQNYAISPIKNSPPPFFLYICHGYAITYLLVSISPSIRNHLSQQLRDANADFADEFCTRSIWLPELNCKFEIDGSIYKNHGGRAISY